MVRVQDTDPSASHDKVSPTTIGALTGPEEPE